MRTRLSSIRREKGNKMNRNQRATRNTAANKPFVSGGVMTNFTATPASGIAPAAAETILPAQAQAINVGLTMQKKAKKKIYR